MTPTGSVQSRLKAFLDEIDDLERSEFPYEDSRQALHRLRGKFAPLLKKMGRLKPTANAQAVNEVANWALELCTRYLPVLGFILRSTNVRNGFELVGPLRRMARKLLQPDHKPGETRVQLLLSSEWEYMPLFRCEADLPNYVMIGLPAHESSNPLLFPLCGHELGHALWGTQDREGRYSTLLGESFDSNIKRPETWKRFKLAFPQFSRIKEPPGNVETEDPSLFEDEISFSTIRNIGVQWATMQAEEIFCDTVGIRLFGEAYPLAFTYLMSPGNIGKRLPGYPSLRARVEHMRKACEVFSVPGLGVSASTFDERAEWELPSDRLLMSLADEAVTGIGDQIISDVSGVADHAKMPGPDANEINRILGKFRWAVPACNCRCLTDILNAGWKVHEDSDFWKQHPRIHEKKDSVLKELLLKNIELLEVEQIDAEMEDPDATSNRSNR